MPETAEIPVHDAAEQTARTLVKNLEEAESRCESALAVAKNNLRDVKKRLKAARKFVAEEGGGK